jgi:hypothetical protein
MSDMAQLHPPSLCASPAVPTRVEIKMSLAAGSAPLEARDTTWLVFLDQSGSASDEGAVCCVDTELASDASGVSDMTIRRVSPQQLVAECDAVLAFAGALIRRRTMFP